MFDQRHPGVGRTECGPPDGRGHAVSPSRGSRAAGQIRPHEHDPRVGRGRQESQADLRPGHEPDPTDFRGGGECSWDGELALHDAMTADPATRRRALPPEEAAWRWLTHADPRDDDARELQIARLRSGLDLLVVHARLHASSCRPVVAAAPQLSELVARAVQAERPIEPVTTFIEIVLVDEAGNPIAGEPYELELPDGRLRLQVYPRDVLETAVLPRHRGEVRFLPHITAENLRQHQAAFYRKPHDGRLCAILGGRG